MSGLVLKAIVRSRPYWLTLSVCMCTDAEVTGQPCVLFLRSMGGGSQPKYGLAL